MFGRTLQDTIDEATRVRATMHQDTMAQFQRLTAGPIRTRQIGAALLDALTDANGEPLRWEAFCGER